MGDFVFAGYLITQPWRAPEGLRPLAPESIFTASGCLTEFFPDSWTFEWVKESAERAANSKLFGLNDDALGRVMAMSDAMLASGELALYRYLQTEDAVRSALARISPTFRPVVLGLALDRALVPAFLEEASCDRGNDQLLVGAVLSNRGVPPGGQLLGFEPLGFEYGASDAHSWWCNDLPKDCLRLTGEPPNSHGLLDDPGAAEAFCQHVNEDELGEPVLWSPWALLDFSARFLPDSGQEAPMLGTFRSDV